MLDAVVIGTGFGGAVSACRLAQAGLTVRILERGRRYDKGGFPRDFTNPKNGWLWEHGQGLYDVKPFNQMTVVQGAGYGGGSLIYANVHLRPVPAVFESGWPTGYDRTLLDPYYDLVGYMLDIKPITASPQGLPPKTRLMRAVAERTGRLDQFCYPNVAIDFSAPGRAVRNKHDVPQEGCNYCGECDIGCNVHAKNTLDLNYLAIAERRGAQVSTQCEATRIEPLMPADPAAGYRVYYRDYTDGGATRTAESKAVFLCAGAVNSTELLLRCRDQHKTLPGLSERLGFRYSGNGDFLAFAFDTDEAFEPARGPTITTGIVVDEGSGPSKTWFIFEEGGYPKELSALVQMLNPQGTPFARAAELLRDQVSRELGRHARATVPSDDGPGRRSAVFLAMGLDAASGRITLGPLGHLKVLWDLPPNLPLYDTQTRIAQDVAGALGGKAAENPLWQRLRLPATVHNLGGCVMGDTVAYGVVDPTGQVFGYPGLYVMDGGALPEATGVNPSHTISAVAERNIEIAARRLTGNGTWTAPERAKAVPIVDPLDRIFIPAGGTRPSPTPTVGISFRERLRGYHQLGAAAAGPGPGEHDAFIAAEKAGKRAGSRLEVDITITAASVDRFLSEPAHAALLEGTVRADGLTDPAGARATNGVFNLYSELESGPPKLHYVMPFTGSDGRDYQMEGHADVDGPGPFDLMATSVVYATLRRGTGREDPVVSTGIVRLGLRDLVDEMRSIRVFGTDDLGRKQDAVGRFFKRFLGPVSATALRGFRLG